MLAATGLLELVPRRGAYVRHPSIIELVEMFEVMAELEGMCGRLAARRVTEEDLDIINEAASACEKALLEATQMPTTGKTSACTDSGTRQAATAFWPQKPASCSGGCSRSGACSCTFGGRKEQSMAEHRAIITALTEGDAVRAEQELRDHVAIQGEKFNDLMAHYKRSTMRKAV